VATLEAKSLDTPEESLEFPKLRGGTVTVGGVTIGRGTIEPGWRWSEHIKPIAGTASCEAPHTLYVMSGRLHVAMDDGTEGEIGPGMAAVIPPGHDAWVVGDEPCMTLDFTGAKAFGGPR
jgi:quercetin dioxygenase-like cupin family protein